MLVYSFHVISLLGKSLYFGFNFYFLFFFTKNAFQRLDLQYLIFKPHHLSPQALPNAHSIL